MPKLAAYIGRIRDLERLKAFVRSEFMIPFQAHTRLFKLKTVNSAAMFRKHVDFGCDSMVNRYEFRKTWISVVAEDPLTGQIVFGTTFFLFHPRDPVTFWKPVPDSDKFEQVPVSKMEWYRGGRILSVGYTLFSHSGAADIVETESIRRINGHFRKKIPEYISVFKRSVVLAAKHFDADVLIEPHGSCPLPVAFTFFPSVKVQGGQLEHVGRTRRESRITEHICRRVLQIPLRKEVNGLNSLSSVYFGKIGSASQSERIPPNG